MNTSGGNTPRHPHTHIYATHSLTKWGVSSGCLFFFLSVNDPGFQSQLLVSMTRLQNRQKITEAVAGGHGSRLCAGPFWISHNKATEIETCSYTPRSPGVENAAVEALPRLQGHYKPVTRWIKDAKVEDANSGCLPAAWTWHDWMITTGGDELQSDWECGQIWRWIMMVVGVYTGLVGQINDGFRLVGFYIPRGFPVSKNTVGKAVKFQVNAVFGRGASRGNAALFLRWSQPLCQFLSSESARTAGRPGAPRFTQRTATDSSQSCESDAAGHGWTGKAIYSPSINHLVITGAGSALLLGNSAGSSQRAQS